MNLDDLLLNFDNTLISEYFKSSIKSITYTIFLIK